MPPKKNYKYSTKYQKLKRKRRQEQLRMTNAFTITPCCELKEVQDVVVKLEKSDDINGFTGNHEFIHYTAESASTAAEIVSTLEPLFVGLTNDVQNVRHEVENLQDDSNYIVAQIVNALKPLILSLINEIQIARHEVQSLKREHAKLKTLKNHSTIRVMPRSPFIIMQDFLNFEALLRENADQFNAFEKELLTVAKLPKFIKNCWWKIFKDELAENLCWSGTEDKLSVRDLTTGRAIRNAAISIGLSEEEYIQQTKDFFKYAKMRHSFRNSYKPKNEK